MRANRLGINGLGGVLLAVWLLAGGTAYGNGVIIIEPVERIRPATPQPARNLQMLKQVAEVKIRDLAAVTRVEQTFGNPNSFDVEGTYLLPVPDKFNVNDFAMTVNGQKVTGELLDADKARRIYREIVSRNRDPGLLEFVGQRLYRARVFPIPANGKVEVAIEITGQLEPAGGLVTYRYPLKPDKPLGHIERFEFSADITTDREISTVFCPTHKVDIDRKDPRHVKVRYEARDLEPSHDLQLHYRLGDEQFGLSLLAYRERGEDGYLMAWISPQRRNRVDALPKDICFVIDTSGSMAERGGQKIAQAREAVQFCLGNLGEDDRFNVISFSTEVRPFRDELVKATRENVREAVEHAADLKAIGGTDIHGALLAAMKMQPKDEADRPYMVVFLTDGMPTVGVTEPQEILKAVRQEASQRVRLFVFGVGYNVNTVLLDSLAEQNRGTRMYVTPDEDLEVKLGTFYTQIASPVLTDLELKFDGVKVYDVYPKRLPDLFAGSDLVVLARYSEGGEASVTLSGRQGSERSRFTYRRDLPDRDRQQDYLPRLWAMRKVGYLLDEIRLHGENEELKKEVVDLAKRFGIVTPYTSYLVLEDERMLTAGGRGSDASRDGDGFSPRYRARIEPLRELLESNAPAAARAKAAGAAARQPAQAGQGQVDLSQEALALKELARDTSHPQLIELRAYAVAPAAPVTQPGAGGGRSGEGARLKQPISVMTLAAGRAFYRQDNKWIDSLYDGKSEPKKLKAFSDEYFRIVQENPQLRAIFALGPNVVFMLDGQAYEVTQE